MLLRGLAREHRLENTLMRAPCEVYLQCAATRWGSCVQKGGNSDQKESAEGSLPVGERQMRELVGARDLCSAGVPSLLKSRAAWPWRLRDAFSCVHSLTSFVCSFQACQCLPVSHFVLPTCMSLRREGVTEVSWCAVGRT